ncbi:MAG: cobalt-precorrin-5B (C(1))-methyltransferase CbiD [Lachnospiraceae bacterium]
MENGLQEHSIIKGNKKLRLGYTTGSCAAAAAKAAAVILFSHKNVDYIELDTPRGIQLYLEIRDIQKEEDSVSCAIEKDAGDDPDITNGLWIYAKVSKTAKAGIRIIGGSGVGRVTKPGLEQPVGNPAINKTPREMIEKEIEQVCRNHHYGGGIQIELSVPNGEIIAQKTFNPRLGILGGISILGTTGIVEPMSEEALCASIRVEMKQQVEIGRKSLVITPGNYGREFLKENFSFDLETAIKCSNFVGDTIDMAVELGVSNLLFVAHIGKFIKVAGGIMNTHSKHADARMELLAANAAIAGAESSILREILEEVTTEGGIRILKERGYLHETMKVILPKIEYYLNKRSFGKIRIAVVLFSRELGELGYTKEYETVKKELEKEIELEIELEKEKEIELELEKELELEL